MRVDLLFAPFDAAAHYAAFVNQRGTGTSGAIATMVGIARAEAKDGRALSAVRLEHYGTATIASMQQIANDAAQRFGVDDMLVLHRAGLILPGEAIVLVAAAAAHRRAAFDTVDYLMDSLKSDAIFWKQEICIDGDIRWIEPTEQDAVQAKRWA